jgi:hypothetical protein
VLSAGGAIGGSAASIESGARWTSSTAYKARRLTKAIVGLDFDAENRNRGEFRKPEFCRIDAIIQNVETAIEEGTCLAIFPQFIVTATA